MKGNKRRTVGTSAVNTSLTVSTPDDGAARRLLQVLVHYSGSPTHSGVSVYLISAAHENVPFLLFKGTANAQDTVYVPDGEVILMEDEHITVTAPAGGAGIASSVSIYTEIVEY